LIRRQSKTAAGWEQQKQQMTAIDYRSHVENGASESLMIPVQQKLVGLEMMRYK
jgi:hypothetical protein